MAIFFYAVHWRGSVNRHKTEQYITINGDHLPHGIALESKKYTITLEESKTGKSDSSDWAPNTIPVDYNIGAITGIFANAAGTGTNYWTGYEGSTFHGNWVYLSSTATAATTADTAYWVTYVVDTQIVAMGAPMPDGGGILAVAHTVLSGINGTNDSSTPVDYEISGLTT